MPRATYKFLIEARTYFEGRAIEFPWIAQKSGEKNRSLNTYNWLNYHLAVEIVKELRDLVLRLTN